MRLGKGTTTVEEEVEVEVVVGTCVCYYLFGPGHDARSRIGSTTCIHFWSLLFKLDRASKWCSVGQKVRKAALNGVWRHQRFIVYSALVGYPVHIWILNSQIVAPLLQLRLRRRFVENA